MSPSRLVPVEAVSAAGPDSTTGLSTVYTSLWLQEAAIRAAATDCQLCAITAIATTTDSATGDPLTPLHYPHETTSSPAPSALHHRRQPDSRLQSTGARVTAGPWVQRLVLYARRVGYPNTKPETNSEHQAELRIADFVHQRSDWSCWWSLRQVSEQCQSTEQMSWQGEMGNRSPKPVHLHRKKRKKKERSFSWHDSSFNSKDLNFTDLSKDA